MPIPASKPATVTRRLIADEIYDSLLELIVSCKLEPGECLQDAEIAAFYGASRTPVREAFARLAENDLVKILPQRGTFVEDVSIKTFQDSIGILGWLTAYAVREVVPDLDESDKSALKHIRDDLLAHPARMAETIRDGSIYSSFYDIYLNRYANAILQDQKKRHIPHVRRTNNIYGHLVSRELAENQKYQFQLIEASLDGDADRASQALLNYVNGATDILSQASLIAATRIEA